MWTIFRGQLQGEPEKFFVRRCRIQAGVVYQENVTLVAETLEAAREMIPQDLVLIPRMEQDDPSVVEVWT